jgi:hypothetical protein
MGGLLGCGSRLAQSAPDVPHGSKADVRVRLQRRVKGSSVSRTNQKEMTR